MWSRLRDGYRTTFGQAMVGAVLLWAALAPLNLWPLAWIAPVWWVLLIRRRQLAPRRPYLAIWLAGFLFWLAAVHWVRLSHWAAYFGWIALAFYLAFYFPVFIGLGRVAVHRLRVPLVLAAPMVWTGLELARGHLLTGFTMASLGHSQYRWIELIQLSDLAGAYGVGFVVMFVAACLARAVPSEGRPTAVWPLVPAAVIVGAALLYGHLRVSRDHPPPQARIALIQGSIDTQIKSDPQMRQRVHGQYLILSQEALDRYGRLDLIVWPETMFRDPLVTYDDDARMPEEFDGTEEEFRQALWMTSQYSQESMAALAWVLGCPLILGVDYHHYGSEGVERFNSAVFVADDGELLERYDKIHPVLFGEYVPLVNRFAWLQGITPVRFSLSAGKRPVGFELPDGLRIVPSICYETVIPHVIRRQVNFLKTAGSEPDVMVNLTNDGWFWGSSELEMHLACGVFRAVECRKPLLIASNTGISAWIDGDGRIVRRGPRRHKDPQLQSDAPAGTGGQQRRELWCEQYGPWPKGTATILAEIAPDSRKSWYLDHGDWPAGVCLAVCVVVGLAGGCDWLRRRRGALPG